MSKDTLQKCLALVLSHSHIKIMENHLVYNIEPASPSMIRSLDRHCRDRVPDGASAIDPTRSNLNAVLVGNDAGVLASLDDLYSSGVKEPAPQAESPYLRIVVSASPAYFRPTDPDPAGTWDQDRLEAWTDAVMGQLKAEHGDDLVYAEIHLDEDTPHIHAVVAPTYGKKPRKPGKMKRGETPEQFEARKAAALDADGVRTVGRASHPVLSQPGSFQRLRERMAVAVDHLGIGYGEDRSVDAPPGTSTRQWVKEQAARIRAEQAQLATDRATLDADRATLADDRNALAADRAALDAARSKAQDEKRLAETEAAALLADQLAAAELLHAERKEIDQLRAGIEEDRRIISKVLGVVHQLMDVAGKALGVVWPKGMDGALKTMQKAISDLSTEKARPEADRDRDGPGL